MPRKLRRCKKTSNVTQENSENNAKYVNIGEKNLNNWYSLRDKLNFKCDRDFVEYLLSLAEKYLKSKLQAQCEEEGSGHHGASVIQPCPNFRQMGDESESRVLSAVDGNSVSVLKKLNDEKLPPVFKEDAESEVCRTNSTIPPTDGARSQPIPIINDRENSINEIPSGQDGIKSFPVEGFEEERVEENTVNNNSSGSVKPKKKRHKFDSKEPDKSLDEPLVDPKLSEAPNTDGTFVTSRGDVSTVQSMTDTKLMHAAARNDSLEQVPTTGSSSITANAKPCPLCDYRHLEDLCPLRCPVRSVQDTVGMAEWEMTDALRRDASFALASLPGCLELREVGTSHGLGVFSRVELPRYTEFGPLIAPPIREMEIADDSSMKHVWEVAEGRYLMSEDENKSNWLRWLRPAPVKGNCNVMPVPSADRNAGGQEGNVYQLYFVTTVPIKAGDELLFWTQTTGAWASKNMDKTSCGGCNLKFEHSLYYRLHCSVFHEASLSLTVRKYHCKVCGAQVLGKQNIMKHAALYHNGKGAYQCQFCSKYFLRLNYLEMHRNYGCSANPHRARPLCDYCGRKFCQPQKLKVHIKRMHSDISEVLREFQCSECLKVLGSRAALQRHTKEVHKRPSSNLQQCSKCDKTFQNRSNLKIHMLTHSGIKPFKCQELSCLAAFTTKQCLQFHYRKVHGLTDGQFPRIVRSVEYTFDAYAGHRQLSSDGDSASGENDAGIEQEHYNMAPPVPPESTSLSSSSVDDDQMQPESNNSYQQHHNIREIISNRESEDWMDDNVKSREVGVISGYPRDNACNESCCNGNDNRTVVMSSSTSKASQLVEAALDAAEKDISERRIHHTDILPLQEQPPMRPLTPIFYSNVLPHDRLQSPKRRHWEEGDETYNHPSPEKLVYDDQRQIDEGMIQNLSLVKRHPPPPLPPEYLYKYSQEERPTFPDESLDMSRNGIMYHPPPPPPPPHHAGFVRYPPSAPNVMYDQHYAASIAAAHHHTEVLRVISLAHTHSLSISNGGGGDNPEGISSFRHPHHMLHPPPPPHPTSPPSLPPPVPPPPDHEETYPQSSYPMSPPGYPTSKSPSAITYHHYSGYY